MIIIIIQYLYWNAENNGKYFNRVLLFLWGYRRVYDVIHCAHSPSPSSAELWSRWQRMRNCHYEQNPYRVFWIWEWRQKIITLGRRWWCRFRYVKALVLSLSLSLSLSLYLYWQQMHLSCTCFYIVEWGGMAALFAFTMHKHGSWPSKNLDIRFLAL